MSLLLAAVMVMGMLITGIPSITVYADAGVPGMPPINLALASNTNGQTRVAFGGREWTACNRQQRCGNIGY